MLVFGIIRPGRHFANRLQKWPPAKIPRQVSFFLSSEPIISSYRPIYYLGICLSLTAFPFQRGRKKKRNVGDVKRGNAAPRCFVYLGRELHIYESADRRRQECGGGRNPYKGALIRIRASCYFGGWTWAAVISLAHARWHPAKLGAVPEAL